MKNRFLFFALPVALLMSCGSQTNEQNTPPDEVATPVTGDVHTPSPTPQSLVMYSSLNQYLETAKAGMEALPEARKNQLEELALYVQTQRQAGAPVNLIFICTHNSRRSHMGQLWAATAAHYYGIGDGLHTFSGGTEATAFNPRAVAAMERAGFQVNKPGGENPRYEVQFAENASAMTCFSKKYDDPENPKENFAAVMTCSEADKACPYIPGASLRLALPYDDPKEADGTGEETARYDERCLQIATEMCYVMAKARAI